jgi:hypothetical protein
VGGVRGGADLARRDRDAVLPEEVLGLVLVKIHAYSFAMSVGRAY